MQIGAQDIHKLRWELKNRSEEVEVLQKALQDAKLYLYDEREQVIKLTHENENLKQQEVEDRRRIQELLALTQPASEEVRFHSIELSAFKLAHAPLHCSIPSSVMCVPLLSLSTQRVRQATGATASPYYRPRNPRPRFLLMHSS